MVGRWRSLLDDPQNVETLLQLMRGLAVPDGHTGEIGLRLHTRDGKILAGTYGIEKISLGRKV